MHAILPTGWVILRYQLFISLIPRLSFCRQKLFSLFLSLAMSRYVSLRLSTECLSMSIYLSASVTFFFCPTRIILLPIHLRMNSNSSVLGIDTLGLYNFRPSVRPIPMTIHIQGFPGKHYCPRMATMNKPTYAAIMEHSPAKPVLVFVSSRRQTRLTALDLISYCASDDNPKKFLHMEELEAEDISRTMRDRCATCDFVSQLIRPIFNNHIISVALRLYYPQLFYT